MERKKRFRERVKAKTRQVKENIKNVPNFLTLIRVILSFALIAMVLTNHSLLAIALVFAIAALTDGADGYIARRYNQITRFGRKFDIFADRLLMVSLVVSLILLAYVNNSLDKNKIYLIFILMSREIFCAPLFLIALVKKNSRPVPHARKIGKITTFLQGISLPIILLGFNISWIFAAVTFLSGIIAAFYFNYDSLLKPNNEFQKNLDEHYQKI